MTSGTIVCSPCQEFYYRLIIQQRNKTITQNPQVVVIISQGGNNLAGTVGMNYVNFQTYRTSAETLFNGNFNKSIMKLNSLL